MQKPEFWFSFSCSLLCREGPGGRSPRWDMTRESRAAASLGQGRGFTIPHPEPCPRCPTVGAKHHTRRLLPSDGNVGEPQVVPRLCLGWERQKKRQENKIITHTEQPFLAGLLAVKNLLVCPETAPEYSRNGREEPSRKLLCQLLASGAWSFLLPPALFRKTLGAAISLPGHRG